MVVDNIVYSSQTSRIDRGNIVCSDRIRNIAHPQLLEGGGWGWYFEESDTLALPVNLPPPPRPRASPN
jgi:hypothetical protein